MFYVPPYITSVAIGWFAFTGDNEGSLPFSASLIGAITVQDIVDFTALAVIFAGVFIVARYRTALEVSQASAEAWKLERDASVAHVERLVQDLTLATAKISTLEGRPSLEKMEALMERMIDLAAQHERNAETRKDEVVSAIRQGT